MACGWSRCLESDLHAFLDDQRDVIECIRRDLVREPEAARRRSSRIDGDAGPALAGF